MQTFIQVTRKKKPTAHKVTWILQTEVLILQFARFIWIDCYLFPFTSIWMIANIMHLMAIYVNRFSFVSIIFSYRWSFEEQNIPETETIEKDPLRKNQFWPENKK